MHAALLIFSSVLKLHNGTINYVHYSKYGKNDSFNSSINTDNICIATSASSLSYVCNSSSLVPVCTLNTYDTS